MYDFLSSMAEIKYIAIKGPPIPNNPDVIPEIIAHTAAVFRVACRLILSENT